MSILLVFANTATCIFSFDTLQLTLLHSEMPKLYAILAFPSATELLSKVNVLSKHAVLLRGLSPKRHKAVESNPLAC